MSWFWSPGEWLIVGWTQSDLELVLRLLQVRKRFSHWGYVDTSDIPLDRVTRYVAYSTLKSWWHILEWAVDPIPSN